MKKFILGAFAIGFVLTGCISDDEDGVINIRKSGEKNLFESVVIKDGYFTDSRDNQKYKIEKIGNYYWFAENLRYADSSKTKNLKNNMSCLDDKSKNCEKYGPLYTWTAAMDLPDSLATNRNYNLPSWQVQGICPNGWRIPSTQQWYNLLQYVDQMNGTEGDATSLKSISTWDKDDSTSSGVNRFGFNVLAGGRHNNEGGFLSGGKYAYIWTSDEVDAGTAKGYSFHHNSSVVSSGNYYKDHGLSIRCVSTPESHVSVEGDLDSTYLEEIPFDYGTMEIDGKSYKTIEIGSQTWMAENVNYKTGNSWCYKNEDSNCKKYGRLYDWETAQTVCPEGWKLPSGDELMSVFTYHADPKFVRSIEGWKNKDGLNFWGFNLLPAGGYKGGDFFDESSSAYLWSSESFGDSGYALFLSYYGGAVLNKYIKDTGYSVRCLKE